MNEGFASTKWGSWYPFARESLWTRSPPIVPAIEAKSSSVETMRIFASIWPAETGRTRAVNSSATSLFIGEIGRASCRERGDISGRLVAVEKKTGGRGGAA